MANLEHPALQGIPQRFVIVNESDVVEGIETFVSEHKIDMLVMVAWHHNFFERLFHRSITKQIALELEKLALFILHD